VDGRVVDGADLAILLMVGVKVLPLIQGLQFVRIKATNVVCQVVLEAPRHERPGRVSPCELLVTSAGAVHQPTLSHVVHDAVYL